MAESSQTRNSQDRGRPRSWLRRAAQVALSAVVSVVVREEVDTFLDQLTDEDIPSDSE